MVVVCGRCIVHRLCSTTCKHPCLEPFGIHARHPCRAFIGGCRPCDQARMLDSVRTEVLHDAKPTHERRLALGLRPKPHLFFSKRFFYSLKVLPDLFRQDLFFICRNFIFTLDKYQNSAIISFSTREARVLKSQLLINASALSAYNIYI